MNDQQIEKEIVAKGKTAPRVTPEHIESIIVSEHYFTAQNGVIGGQMEKDAISIGPLALDLLTFCVLVLENGFTVTGESACASPENFDAEIGRKIARQNAFNKIWLLEGYLLKQKLSEQ
ncbi:Gp49 family protein [Citrobacter freundii]|uniref:Gp49 family protein n=1 Tax=Citrobacter freundii TaxID=546 RepID=UPI001C7CC4C6|nr:Gp49 family protein [Citrobacter freundii]